MFGYRVKSVEVRYSQRWALVAPLVTYITWLVEIPNFEQRCKREALQFSKFARRYPIIIDEFWSV